MAWLEWHPTLGDSLSWDTNQCVCDITTHHGCPPGSGHPFGPISTLGEWFSGSCHPTCQANRLFWPIKTPSNLILVQRGWVQKDHLKWTSSGFLSFRHFTQSRRCDELREKICSTTIATVQGFWHRVQRLISKRQVLCLRRPSDMVSREILCQLTLLDLNPLSCSSKTTPGCPYLMCIWHSEL